MKFYKCLFFSLLICVGGGWLSGLVTQQGIEDWYNHLIHPPGTPPNFIFPIVWTLLYVMISVSLALVLSSQTKNKTAALLFFSAQLVLNFTWSWLFFGMRAPMIAMIDLVFLWICIVATILAFTQHSKIGAYLLIPYLLWVTYAGYLNLSIWIMND